jgi:hypothetical protein
MFTANGFNNPLLFTALSNAEKGRKTMSKYKDFKDLSALAKTHGFVVTSTNGGKHNVGSKHYRGLAIDVRTRDKTVAEIQNFISVCLAERLTVRDERKRPVGQKVWSGSHLHIEI